MWQTALRSYSSYTSILSECWPRCHSDSHAIFYKDWSGTSHRQQPGLASLVLLPRLDQSDYSEPCTHSWSMIGKQGEKNMRRVETEDRNSANAVPSPKGLLAGLGSCSNSLYVLAIRVECAGKLLYFLYGPCTSP